MKKLLLSIQLLAAFLTCSVATSATSGYEPDYYGKRDEWLRKAEEAKPELISKVYRPLYLVQPVEDEAAYQGWKIEKTGELSSYIGINMREVPDVMLDFGRHMTGYFTFRIKTLRATQDAPIRIRFTFGEVPAEMATPFDPFPGSLSRAWMQDEVLTIEEVDRDITIPRRISGRYMRVELLGDSVGFDYAMEDIRFSALSSTDMLMVEPLGEETPEMIRNINEVSVATLRECMQTVYEDGPKRDHRLWVGDLYLESLANRHSFRNFDLTKRCLYLFAALTAEDGTIISNLYENPVPHPQVGSYMLTYSLLFNSTLLEYLKDTGDTATAAELWPVAKRQIEDALTYVNDDYIFDKSRKAVWLFFDWRDGLDIDAPIQAAVIFALNQTYELANILGKESEVKQWKNIEKNMIKAARKHMYDKQGGVILSGEDRQLSVMSQAWMVKAGVLNQTEGQKAIATALNNESTVMPGTPYATHYLIDAMLQCGMNEAAKDYLVDYWGGMVNKGADTFWEAYDPENDFISPYNFHPLNSYCHAWSCTPVYFIYTYPEIFQKKNI